MREKDGSGLSFRLGTTTGNQARILAEQIVQEQLRQIGIEMKIKNGPIQNILGIDMVSGNFDLLIFAWSGSPDPFGNNVIWLSSAIPPDCPRRLARKYQCEEGGLNYTHTNDPKVDELLKATEREPDPVKRAALYNEADLQLAREQRDGDPVVPEADPARLPLGDLGCRGQPDPRRVHLEHRELGAQRVVVHCAAAGTCRGRRGTLG